MPGGHRGGRRHHELRGNKRQPSAAFFNHKNAALGCILLPLTTSSRSLIGFSLNVGQHMACSSAPAGTRPGNPGTSPCFTGLSRNGERARSTVHVVEIPWFSTSTSKTECCSNCSRCWRMLYFPSRGDNIFLFFFYFFFLLFDNISTNSLYFFLPTT